MDEDETRRGDRKRDERLDSSRLGAVFFFSRCATARDHDYNPRLERVRDRASPLVEIRPLDATPNARPVEAFAFRSFTFTSTRRFAIYPRARAARTWRLEGEARVVVLAARADARILLGAVEGAEDEEGHGEEDEAEGLVVDAEDEAGAVAVEALVDNREGGERLGGEGGHGGGEGNLLGDLDLGDGRLGDDCGEEKKISRGGEGGVVSAVFGGVGAMIRGAEGGI